MDSYEADIDDIPDPLPEPNELHSELIRFLTESREMRQTAKSALQQGLWAGGGAVAGGLLLGPVGGMVGGITGSIVGYLKSDNYDGLVLQLSKVDTQRQRFLLAEVGQVLMVAGASGSAMRSADAFRDSLVHYASSNHVRDQVWRACMNSLQEQ